MRHSLWWSGRALRLHLTLAVVGLGFVALFWWQLRRALSGNELSWAYAVEWPVFLVYAVFMWWRLLHEDFVDRRPDETGRSPGVQSVGDAETPTVSSAGKVRLRHRAEGRTQRRERRLADEDRQRRLYNVYLKSLDNEGASEASGEDPVGTQPEPSPAGPSEP